MALKHKNIVSHFYPSEQSSERIMQHHIIDVYCSVIASTASESDKEFCFQLLLKFLEQSDTALDITNLMKLDDELKTRWWVAQYKQIVQNIAILEMQLLNLQNMLTVILIRWLPGSFLKELGKQTIHRFFFCLAN